MRRNRDELIHLLCEAAETEHSLCCMYLFAGVTLKLSANEGLSWEQLRAVQDWADTLYLIARQEMEHLGLVNNLLTAIGAAPHLWHPNFPLQTPYFSVPFTLEPLSEAVIKRFLCFERPAGTELPFCPPADHGLRPVEPISDTVEFGPVTIDTIEDLYERIRWLIIHLPFTDEQLFVGPPKAQIDGTLLHVNFPRVGALGGIFDTTLFDISDRRSSMKAIDLIIEQGEGNPGHDEFSHFNRLERMLQQYRRLTDADPSFQPARNVVANPALNPDDAEPGSQLITDGGARAVLDLLNGAYETLILLFTRVYAPGGETSNEVTGLLYTLFPMMTQIVRPISEILVTLPAFAGSSEPLAGPSYEISQSIDLLPDKQSTWRVLDERLRDLAEDALAVSKLESIGEPERLRLASIAQNLRIMSAKFARVSQGTYPQALLTPGLFAHLPTQLPGPGQNR